MPSRALAVLCTAAALLLAACGSTKKPLAGTGPAGRAGTGARGVVDDPRTQSLTCLRKLKISIVPQGKTDLQLGSAPAQARVVFDPTPGSAQAAQIAGQAQGAEVVGSALLYPGQMSDSQLKQVETCLAVGVHG